MTCIPRDKMPQVPDTDRLFIYLSQCGVPYFSGDLPVSMVQQRQCPDPFDPHLWHDTLTPILVSHDLVIVDGHHRFAWALSQGWKSVPTLLILAPFERCRALLLEMPGTYRLNAGEDDWTGAPGAP